MRQIPSESVEPPGRSGGKLLPPDSVRGPVDHALWGVPVDLSAKPAALSAVWGGGWGGGLLFHGDEQPPKAAVRPSSFFSRAPHDR